MRADHARRARHHEPAFPPAPARSDRRAHHPLRGAQASRSGGQGPAAVPRFAGHDRVTRRSPSQLFNAVGITLIHIGTVYAFFRGADAGLVAMAVAFYFVRMFAVTGVYHRYFAHRTYKTSRVVQFLFALLGTSATQKGPLWWAATHRLHH